MSGLNILNLIADYYNPLLLLVAVTTLVFTYMQLGTREGILRTIQLAIGIIIVYGVLWLDNYFWIWPLMNLDYSTHTAFALAILTFLMLTPVKGKTFLLVSLIAYIVIIIYKKYHTTGDIFSTAAVILPIVYIAMTAVKARK